MADAVTEPLIRTEYISEDVIDLEQRRMEHFESSDMSTAEKLNNIGRFLSRQELAKIAWHTDVVRNTSGVTGSILDVCVYHGHGLMLFAKAVAAFEPYNYTYKVCRFDTFAGNTEPGEKDGPNFLRHKRDFGYFADSREEIQDAVEIFDADRSIPHIEKVVLIRGDVCEKAPRFLETHPHVMVRILSLCVNLYEPTVALRAFVPRTPKGSCIMAYVLNYNGYTSMVTSLLEEVGSWDVRLETPPFYPAVNYIWL